MKSLMWAYSSWVEETDPEVLYKDYNERLVQAGFSVLNVIEHYFEPQGYTALFLLGESHLALHTFPEQGQTYVELVSCVKKPFDEFVKTLS